MSKKIIYSVIFILLLSAFLTFIWFKYEKPVQDLNDEFVKVNIYAENQNNVLSKTGYDIFVDGVFQQSGETLKQSPISISVPLNSTVKVNNKNFPEQNYYIFEKEVKVTENNTRVKLNLVEPSKLQVELVGNLSKSGDLIFNLSSFGEFNEIYSCIEWSRNFVYVKSNSSLVLEKPKRYKGYDKCFNLETSVNSSINYEFTLSQKIWGTLKSSDYIKIVFIDSQKGIFDKETGFDEFAKDQEYFLDLEGFHINNI